MAKHKFLLLRRITGNPFPIATDQLQVSQILAAVFFQSPVILLIMLQADLIIVILHRLSVCHDSLMIDSTVPVPLPYFVYLHLVFLIEVNLGLSGTVESCEMFVPSLNSLTNM